MTSVRGRKGSNRRQGHQLTPISSTRRRPRPRYPAIMLPNRPKIPQLSTLAVLLVASCCLQHRGDTTSSSTTALHAAAAGGIFGILNIPILTADATLVRSEEEVGTDPIMESSEGESDVVDVVNNNEASSQAYEEKHEEQEVKLNEEAPPKQDNEAASAKKKGGVPFGGFAGTTAAAATADGKNTSASTTSQSTIRSDDIIPPDGFVLASRIVSIDGLSFFVDSAVEDGEAQDDVSAAPTVISPPPILGDLTVPFLDCGAVGSFTDAISMRDCSFRHLPSGAEPFGWSTVDTPQLVVALQPLEVTVSGGGGDDGLEATRRIFRPGDVLLFEDTEGKGHKMKAAPVKKKGATGGKPAATPALHPDMSVLIISLQYQKRHGNHHRRTGTSSAGNGDGGKDNKTTIRLPALFGRRNNHKKEGGAEDGGDPPRPCLVETDGTYSSLGPPASQSISDVLPSPGRLIRGAVGAVLSALVTDRWLGRGQPKVSGWLGGCALVLGGTCGFAAIGEGTLESLADWWEEFVISRRYTDGEDEDEGNMGEDNDDDLDLEGLKEEIKEEILPTLFAGRNNSSGKI